jgi:hypothetical protein
VKIVVSGIRAHGFKGRAPHLLRELDSGTLQLVNVYRQKPFRDPIFGIKLSVIPGALMRGWQATGHWALKPKHYMGGGGGIGFDTGLDDADGGLESGQHAPSNPEEADRIAAKVLDQFVRSGLPWLATWSDGRRAIEQLRVCPPRNESGAQAVAALLLDLGPTNDPDVEAVRAEMVAALRRYRAVRLTKLADHEARLRQVVTWDEGEDSPVRNEINLDTWLLQRLGHAPS